MTDLRKLARGRECQVRIPGICRGDRETVVLAHYRLTGLSGLGIKPPDWCASYACSACHDAIDSRMRVLDATREQLHLWHLQGVLRTLAMLEREGVKLW